MRRETQHTCDLNSGSFKMQAKAQYTHRWAEANHIWDLGPFDVVLDVGVEAIRWLCEAVVLGQHKGATEGPLTNMSVMGPHKGATEGPLKKGL